MRLVWSDLLRQNEYLAAMATCNYLGSTVCLRAARVAADTQMIQDAHYHVYPPQLVCSAGRPALLGVRGVSKIKSKVSALLRARQAQTSSYLCPPSEWLSKDRK